MILYIKVKLSEGCFEKIVNQEQIEIELALKWALEYLVSHNDSTIISHQKITETSYSVVYKITTSKNTFYLKKTPLELSTESQILTYLYEQDCSHIPTPIAENKQLCCFLMTSCGDVTLRQLFKEKVDAALLNTGVLNYTKIQRTVENKIPQLIGLKIPDWRIGKIPLLYHELIDQEELLLSDGLSQEEITELENADEFGTTLCESLAKYQIPETMNHCDFQENNMVLNQKTGNISIIDWGETVIAHPFLSLSGCLWNITYFHGIKPGDKIYEVLQRKWISPWLDLHQEHDLLDALKIATQLTGIFAALGYKRMYDATMTQTRTVQQEHPGSIAGCLRSFLRESRLA
ncbi:Phosphotransferase enzyme family protein [Legionella gratiana]|uniref:Phosphotransferase enzyme family n=1 Tax=Legionella gratiana TaxID=45066 RepID=A0A378JFT9_9GAMM|nr:phosphotransferase [Legionella gratiana]KTD10617.1 Phosphotransferase enzyme family protein [Legionella gratiana]STX43540.1 Phosphotransferase enzyme family [Legionella gratiana]